MTKFDDSATRIPVQGEARRRVSDTEHPHDDKSAMAAGADGEGATESEIVERRGGGHGGREESGGLHLRSGQ